MGKHSDPDPRWFWLSLAAAAGKALLAVLLLGGVAVGATMWLGGGGGADPEPAATTAPGTLAPEGTASPESAFETEPEELDESESEGDLATQPAEEATDGGDENPVRATVQVLNGSGDATALQEVIAALEELGYQVVADARASRSYARTTVFWSSGFEEDAEALRDTDDRFGVLEPNDRLDPTINLHVVVGRDWTSER